VEQHVDEVFAASSGHVCFRVGESLEGGSIEQQDGITLNACADQLQECYFDQRVAVLLPVFHILVDPTRQHFNRHHDDLGEVVLAQQGLGAVDHAHHCAQQLDGVDWVPDVVVVLVQDHHGVNAEVEGSASRIRHRNVAVVARQELLRVLLCEVPQQTYERILALQEETSFVQLPLGVRVVELVSNESLLVPPELVLQIVLPRQVCNQQVQQVGCGLQIFRDVDSVVHTLDHIENVDQVRFNLNQDLLVQFDSLHHFVDGV